MLTKAQRQKPPTAPPPLICGPLSTRVVSALACYGPLTAVQLSHCVLRYSHEFKSAWLLPLLARGIVTETRAHLNPRGGRPQVVVTLNEAHPAHGEIAAFGRAAAALLPIEPPLFPLPKPVEFSHEWKRPTDGSLHFFGDTPKSGLFIMVGAAAELSFASLQRNLPLSRRGNIRDAVLRLQWHGIFRTVTRLDQMIVSIDPRWIAARELRDLARVLADRAYPEFGGRIRRALEDDRARRLDDPEVQPKRIRRRRR